MTGQVGAAKRCRLPLERIDQAAVGEATANLRITSCGLGKSASPNLKLLELESRRNLKTWRWIIFPNLESTNVNSKHISSEIDRIAALPRTTRSEPASSRALRTALRRGGAGRGRARAPDQVLATARPRGSGISAARPRHRGVREKLAGTKVGAQQRRHGHSFTLASFQRRSFASNFLGGCLDVGGSHLLRIRSR